MKSTPTLSAYKGQMLNGPMLKKRVTEDEIQLILREKDISTLDDVGAVVLEPTEA